MSQNFINNVPKFTHDVPLLQFHFIKLEAKEARILPTAPSFKTN